MWKLKQMENWHLDNCWQLQQFNHGLKVGQDNIIYYIIIAVEWPNENEVCLWSSQKSWDA